MCVSPTQPGRTPILDTASTLYMWAIMTGMSLCSVEFTTDRFAIGPSPRSSVLCQTFSPHGIQPDGARRSSKAYGPIIVPKWLQRHLGASGGSTVVAHASTPRCVCRHAHPCRYYGHGTTSHCIVRLANFGLPPFMLQAGPTVLAGADGGGNSSACAMRAS